MPKPVKKRRKPSIKQAEIVKRFSRRLRELRIAAGSTQLELARTAHVTVSYIWKLESGGAAPGIDLVERLADALNVGVSDLLPMPIPSQTRKMFRERAEKLFGRLIDDPDTLMMLVSLLAKLTDDAL